MVHHRTVQGLGALFWMCGACGTSAMVVQNLFVYPRSAVDAPAHDPHKFWPLFSLFLGVLSFAMFYGPVVFVPLAFKEIERIRALERPAVWHFFHRYRLLALVPLIPVAVVVNHKTKQWFLSNMIFGGMVVPVSMGLWVGGAGIMLRRFCYFHQATDAGTTAHLLAVVQQDDPKMNDAPIAASADRPKVVRHDQGLFGPVVGHYSVAQHGTLYDLNDHYSKPRMFYGFLVRSPVECALNFAAFLTLLSMTAYAAQAVPLLGVGQPDWLVTSFKLVHLLFHAAIHFFPNFSVEHGLEHLKKPRMVCGIVFGLSRYVVMLILAYRFRIWAFCVLAVSFVAFSKMRHVGELLKTSIAYGVLGYAMCAAGKTCSGNCWLTMGGGALQIVTGLAFYVVGRCGRGGWRFKEWRREDDRAWVPFHVMADLGNALWIIGANFDPSSTDIAFDLGLINTTFPHCVWRQ